MVVVLGLHVLELVHPPLRVALPHLPQGLVLVPALLHVLLVDLVHRRLRLVKTKSKVKFTKVFGSRYTKPYESTIT